MPHAEAVHDDWGREVEDERSGIAGPAVLEAGLGDLRAVGRIREIAFNQADDVTVTDVVLVDETEH